jgi:hypothetical protein
MFWNGSMLICSSDGAAFADCVALNMTPTAARIGKTPNDMVRINVSPRLLATTISPFEYRVSTFADYDAKALGRIARATFA